MAPALATALAVLETQAQATALAPEQVQAVPGWAVRPQSLVPAALALELQALATALAPVPATLAMALETQALAMALDLE